MAVDLLERAKACQNPALRLKLLRLWQEKQARPDVAEVIRSLLAGEPKPPTRPPLSPVDERIGRAKAQVLRSKLARCEACSLARSRTRVVPWTGPLRAWIALVGEAPGYWEDEKGEPFVGKAGRLLNRLLLDVGLRREDLFITNACLCRPAENARPTSVEIGACLPHLKAQLALSGAPIVVAMGNSAIEALGVAGPISRVQGSEVWWEGRLVLPAFHPAAALRDPAKEGLIRAVLARAREFAERIARASPEDLDPRAGDLPEDSRYWREILTCALFMSPRDAYPILWAVRLHGGRCWPWMDGLGIDLPAAIRVEQIAPYAAELRKVPALRQAWVEKRLRKERAYVS